MKNVYFVDVGDYGKYGLLKFVVAHDVKIAINLYLTQDDVNRPDDGKFSDYLEEKNERKHSEYDPELFATLKAMHLPEPRIRDVEQFELKNAIPGEIYHHEIINMHDLKTISDRKAHKKEWHKKALDACKNADLIFLVLDNGLLEKPQYSKTAEKYIFPCEAAEYYKRGQNVVYYCHKGRWKPEPWESYKQYMKGCLPNTALIGLTFHRGTQRSYIFICYQERRSSF